MASHYSRFKLPPLKLTVCKEKQVIHRDTKEEISLHDGMEIMEREEPRDPADH